VQLLQTFHLSSLLSHLRELNLDFAHENFVPQITALGSLLNAVGHNLTYFRVDISPLYLSSESQDLHYWEKLNLSKCTSLETFHICIFSGVYNAYGDYHHDTALQWAAACSILSQVHPSIRDINIGIFTMDAQITDDVVRDVDWDRISRQLLAFRELRRVRFWVEANTDTNKGRADDPQEPAKETRETLEKGLVNVKKAGKMVC